MALRGWRRFWLWNHTWSKESAIFVLWWDTRYYSLEMFMMHQFIIYLLNIYFIEFLIYCKLPCAFIMFFGLFCYLVFSNSSDSNTNECPKKEIEQDIRRSKNLENLTFDSKENLFLKQIRKILVDLIDVIVPRPPCYHWGTVCHC